MDKAKIEKAVTMILEAIGEDPNREGLLDTPARVGRMYEEVFNGLGREADEILSTTFELVDSSMVVQKNIPFYSMCEHHLLPFYGKAHIAYYPDNKVAGLSKLARTVDLYASRPQLQERMNMQIADALMEYLDCVGAFVVVEAEHMCMNMRGVKKPGTSTTTAVARGVFTEDLALKEKALRLMGL